MNKAKERGKWLVALALCVSCFVLCASLMTNSAPTFAEPDADAAAAASATKIVALSTLTPANRTNWDGPAEYIDSKDGKHEGSFKAAVAVQSVGDETVRVPARAEYNIWNKGFTKLTGKIYPAKDNPSASSLTVKIYADDGIPFTPLKLVYESPSSIRPDSLAAVIDAELAGVYDLLIFEVAASDDTGAAAAVVFADMAFTQADIASAPKGSDKTAGLHTLTPLPKKDWEGPNTYTDNKTANHENSLKAIIALNALYESTKWPHAVYSLNKGYTKLTGKIANLKANPDSSDLKVIIRATPASKNPLYTLEHFKAGSDPVSFEVDLANAVLLSIEVQSYTTAASGSEAVYSSLIFYDLQLTQTEGTAPAPAGPGKYKPVADYKNLYEVLDAQGNSKAVKEYIYSTAAPTDGKDPPEKSQKAYTADNSYYIEFAKDSGIFLAVKADGSTDYTKVLWWGKDGKFGTDDDVKTSVKEVSGFYFWQEADGAWKIIQNFFDPARTTVLTESSSTTTRSSVSTTDVDYLSTAESGLPKTGREVFNVGLTVCMGILFMGCAYCGYQAFRRRTVKAKAR